MLEHRPTEGRSGEGVISDHWSRAGLSEDCLGLFFRQEYHALNVKAKVLFQPQPRGAQKRRGVKREKNTLHKFLQRVAWWRGGESGIDHVMGCHVVMLQCCHVVMLQGGNCNRRLLGEGEPWR